MTTDTKARVREDADEVSPQTMALELRARLLCERADHEIVAAEDLAEEFESTAITDWELQEFIQSIPERSATPLIDTLALYEAPSLLGSGPDTEPPRRQRHRHKRRH